MACRSDSRQIADRDPAWQVRDARDRVDVVRRSDGLHGRTDRPNGANRRRQGRPGRLQRQTQAGVDRTLTGARGAVGGAGLPTSSIRLAAIPQEIAKRVEDGTAASEGVRETGAKTEPIAESAWRWARDKSGLRLEGDLPL